MSYDTLVHRLRSADRERRWLEAVLARAPPGGRRSGPPTDASRERLFPNQEEVEDCNTATVA